MWSLQAYIGVNGDEDSTEIFMIVSKSLFYLERKTYIQTTIYVHVQHFIPVK